MDFAELFDAAVVAPRRGFGNIAGLRVIDRPDWMQLVTPAYTKGGFNEVSLAIMGEGEADAIIDRTIAEYRDLGIAFRWWVGPDSRPLDLGERLEKRGLARHSSHVLVRASDPVAGDNAPGLRVAHVDATLLDVLTDTMARGWNVPRGPLLEGNRRLVEDSNDAHHFFVAFLNDEPVATGSYVAFPKSAHLRGGVVLPDHRGKGAYSALVRARIDHARARGLGLITTKATATTSAPRLERMGFERLCTIDCYVG